MTVALVGIGNLGSALIRSLLASSYSIKSVSLESVLLIERDNDKRAELSRQPRTEKGIHCRTLRHPAISPGDPSLRGRDWGGVRGGRCGETGV